MEERLKIAHKWRRYLAVPARQVGEREDVGRVLVRALKQLVQLDRLEQVVRRCTHSSARRL